MEVGSLEVSPCVGNKVGGFGVMGRPWRVRPWQSRRCAGVWSGPESQAILPAAIALLYQQLSHFFTSSYRTSWHVDVLADSPVFHVAAQAGKLIFHQPDILCVGTNANANARSWITCFF